MFINNKQPLFAQSTTSTGAFGGFGQQQQQQQQQQPQQQQQQQQQQAPSLFGGQAQQTGTGLFGSTNASQPSTGLFQQQQQQQQPTGLFSTGFGSQPQQQQQQQPQQGPFGGFGASTTGQNQPGAGFTLFGQPAQQQQQQQVQQPQLTAATTTPLFTRTTKFNDLPEDLRKRFEQIDAHIQGRVQISTELKQHKLGDEPQKGAEQIRSVHKELINSINKLRADLSAMRELRVRMEQAVQDTIASTRIIDAFKASQGGMTAMGAHSQSVQSQSQSGQSQMAQSGLSGQSQSAQTVWLKNYAGFPLEFFMRVTEQLRERLQWFNNSLEQIERKLVSEANHVSATPQSITSTLQAQHACFVALAAKTAALDGELQKLKHTYRMLWRARTGSARDPFNELDRGSLAGTEFGIEGLSVTG